MKCLYQYMKENKEWISNRVLYHIELNRYTNFHTIERLQCCSLIQKISEGINQFIKRQNDPVFQHQNDVEYNAICFFIINTIVQYTKEHSDIGVFLGIIKSYRKAYIDILNNFVPSEGQKVSAYGLVEDFFDELEMMACREWYDIKKNQIEFNALIEYTSALIFMYDKNHFLYVNSIMEEFTGYTRQELLKMKLEEIAHPDFQEELSLHEQAFSKAEAHKSQRRELKIVSKHGKIKWMEFHSISIEFQEKDVLLGVGFDIGEKKKIEYELSESEGRYRKLIELMPDAVYVHADNKILYVNKAGLNLVGASSPKEVEGRNFNELLDIDPYYKSLIHQQTDYTMRNGTLFPAERKYTRKSDGKLLEVETTSTVISYQGKAAILNITRDISERKRIEQLKERVRRKTILLNQTIAYNKLQAEFFANISHELRTPLNVMFSVIQLMDMIDKQGNLEANHERIIKYTSVMKQNCYRLVRMVNNLIDITKIDAGYFEVHLRNINIIGVIENIVLAVADYLSNKGLTIIFDTETEEKIIACDPNLIERIILNLLSNSTKFTCSGGVIEVTVFSRGDKVVILVKDNGIGIPKEKQEEIFERFIQVDKSLSRNREGSGIGLALVKALVEMHNGRIYLNGEVNEGSEFIIELPAERIKEQGETHMPSYVAQDFLERIEIEFSDIYY